MFGQLDSKRLYVIGAVLLAIQVSGCAVRPKMETDAVAEEPQSMGDGIVAEPGAPSTAEREREYRLGFGDVLQIRFFNNEEFDADVTVRPDGRITLQKIGDILVAGMTPMELSRLIGEAYTEILREPEVTVVVQEFGGNSVYVLGEVTSPGSFPLERNMTLIRCIAAAGGPTDEANLGSIMVVRMVADNRVYAKRVDLSMPLVRNDPRLDLAVEPYDIVYVPKTFIGNLKTFLTQVYDAVLPPLDLYARSVYWAHVWKD